MINHEITILYHALENTVANTLDATYAGCMMGRLDETHIVECTPAFPAVF